MKTAPEIKSLFVAAATVVAVSGVALLAARLPLSAVAAPQTPSRAGATKAGGVIQLHNGWRLTPAGRHEEMGDLLLGGAVSPDGKWLAFVNAGAAAHAVHLASAVTGKVVASLPVERAQSGGGIAWSPSGETLYVSGGNAGRIYVLTVGADGALAAQKPLLIAGLATVLDVKPDPGKDAGRDPARQDAPAEDAFLGGLCLSPSGDTLYVANLAGDSVFALNAQTGAIKAQRRLATQSRPGAVAMGPNGRVYVALLGAASIAVLDADTLASVATLKTGAHPNALLLTIDKKRLFASCGNDDHVYVFDVATEKLSEKIAMRLTPRAPAGATPSALALSPNEKTLYVANSDNNDVAVVDVAKPGHSRVEGFIPTTFYPTMVASSRDGKRIFIGSGKGYSTGPNNAAPNGKIDPVAPKGYPYIMDLLKGVLSTVETPDAKRLAAYTRQVYANSPYRDGLLDRAASAPRASDNPIPAGPKGKASPIKRILYIIKENRTYDQVLGDLKNAQGKPIGNGDPSLCLFGEEVTPNHHALAREFTLLDNLYANGEVSVDGHHWSNGAYVPDIMQRTWPAQYGGKGAPPIRYGDFGDPLAETPGGRIWDLCERAGLSYKTYYYHVDKHRSDEWAEGRKRRDRDYQLADIYLKDLAQWEETGAMPRFMVMALGEDHTSGTRAGAWTPQASVASNDLALGKIVEACSKSRFWKEMAIFVIEDDAQNGPDHVDAHRTVALAISPYTKRGHVDSTLYSTCSLLRTMELTLGLPPMSQYDAAATPLYASFGSRPNLAPYTLRPARIDLQAKNQKTAYGAKASLALDLSEPDRLTVADEDTLNRVLWHSVKGAQVPYPGIVRRPLFDITGRPVAVAPGKAASRADDDDDE